MGRQRLRLKAGSWRRNVVEVEEEELSHRCFVSKG
jgi:hypothetical protein